MDSREFMNEFMAELDSGSFEDDRLPDDSVEITEQYIDKRLHDYDLLLADMKDCWATK